MKYILNIKRDVDIETTAFVDYTDYILNLPKGFRFSDEIVHVRGYDSIQELKESAKRDVIVCNCKDCIN
jgi:hypothetical protein